MLSTSFRGLQKSVGNKVIHEQRRFLKRPPINTSQLKEGRRTGALAMKVGMVAIWDKWGIRYPATILQLDNCVVLQKKTIETEGYNALKLAIGEAKLKNVKISDEGQYRKLGLTPGRKIQEFRVSPDCLLAAGTRIRAMHFVPGQLVDVGGITKGKGFQGVMKRWGFGGGRATHGNSLAHRIPGSTGCRQDPGRVFKNKKMAGRMGGKNRTVQNLKVLKVDPVRDLVYVYGGVPGQNGRFLKINDAVKGPFFPSPPPTPTWHGELPHTWQHAPTGTTDMGIFKEPDEQIS